MLKQNQSSIDEDYRQGSDFETLACRHMADSIFAPATFITDPEGDHRLLHASAACRHFGINLDVHPVMHLPECIPSLSSARLNQLWQEVCALHAASLETDFHLPTGQRIAIEITFSLLEHAGQTLMAGYMRDISKRRVLEIECQRLASVVAMQEVEARYREIFENVEDGIFTLDVEEGPRFRFAEINPAMLRMGKLFQGDVIGRYVEETVPEYAAREMNANYRRCLEAGKPIQYEMELEYPGGRMHFESTLVPLRNEWDDIHRIVCLTRDIAERRESRNQLALLESVFDHVAEAIYLIDENAYFIQVNKAACRVLGYTQEELLSMQVFDVDPDFDPERWQQYRAGILAGALSITLETRHRAKNGHIFPVEVNASHIRYQDKNLSIALVRDISERKQVETLQQDGHTEII